MSEEGAIVFGENNNVLYNKLCISFNNEVNPSYLHTTVLYYPANRIFVSALMQIETIIRSSER